MARYHKGSAPKSQPDAVTEEMWTLARAWRDRMIEADAWERYDPQRADALGAEFASNPELLQQVTHLTSTVRNALLARWALADQETELKVALAIDDFRKQQAAQADDNESEASEDEAGDEGFNELSMMRKLEKENTEDPHGHDEIDKAARMASRVPGVPVEELMGQAFPESSDPRWLAEKEALKHLKEQPSNRITIQAARVTAEPSSVSADVEAIRARQMELARARRAGKA